MDLQMCVPRSWDAAGAHRHMQGPDALRQQHGTHVCVSYTTRARKEGLGPTSSPTTPGSLGPTSPWATHA